MIIEKWASKEALLAHAASPHMAANQQRVKDLLVSRKIHVLVDA
jgi:quinol monooxygenase YgiN